MSRVTAEIYYRTEQILVNLSVKKLQYLYSLIMYNYFRPATSGRSAPAQVMKSNVGNVFFRFSVHFSTYLT